MNFSVKSFVLGLAATAIVGITARDLYYYNTTTPEQRASAREASCQKARRYIDDLCHTEASSKTGGQYTSDYPHIIDRCRNDLERKGVLSMGCGN